MSNSSDADLRAARAADNLVVETYVGFLVPNVIALFFIAARFYSRAVILRSWGVDDTLLAIAWVINMALSGLHFAFMALGTGVHIEFVNPQFVLPILKLAFATQFIYAAVLAFTKLGICAFYVHVFRDKRSRILVFSIVAFVIVHSIAVILVLSLKCIPLSNAWILTTPPGYNEASLNIAFYYTIGISNIVTDVALLAFILPRIARLKIQTRQKPILLAIISLSVPVIIAAAIRMVIAIRIQSLGDKICEFLEQETVGRLTTLQGRTAPMVLWSSVEVNTGFICASAPAIKPLIKKMAPGFLSTLEGTKTANHGNESSYFRKGSTQARSRREWKRKSGNNSYELQDVEISAKSHGPNGHDRIRHDSIWRDDERGSNPNGRDTEMAISVLDKELPPTPKSEDSRGVDR